MPTFETRCADDGSKTYRVKIRLKGYAPETATFSRLTDARRWAQATEAAMREGRHFKLSEAKRHTIADLVDRYVREVVPTRPKNAVNTLRHLHWWKAQIGDRPLSDVTPSTIAELRNQLLTQPKAKGGRRAAGTVVRYLASLSHAYTLAVKEWEWVADNPVRKISRPREARGRERYLSDDERESLLAACRESSSQFLYTAVIVAISTGMRKGEIMGLRWKQVDLQRRQIVLTQTKSGASRAVALSALAFTLMEGLSKVRRIDTDLVFHGADPGKPVDLTKPWRTAMAKAGLEDFRFHDLRHTAASYLAMNGATTMEIAAVLGHKTLQMVKRYSHLTSSHTAQVLTRMNEKVFGPACATAAEC